MTTSQILKELREQKGLSQADCAKALGIDRTTYAKYENGGSVKRNVEKLAAFFNVSTDYLLGRTTSTQQATEKTEATDETFGLSIRGDRLLIDGVSLSLHQKLADTVKRAIKIALYEELKAAKEKSQPATTLQADADGNLCITKEELLKHNVWIDTLGNMFCTIDSQIYKVEKLDNGMYMLSPLAPFDPKPGKPLDPNPRKKQQEVKEDIADAA